jgi:hypothetical protein
MIEEVKKFDLEDMVLDEDYVLHGLGELCRMDGECYVFAVTDSEDWGVIPKKLARYMLANCYTDGD